MDFSSLLYTIPACLIAIVLHEWAHGYVSYRLGDPTPKLEGRLSLNPLKHLDLLGTLSLIFFHFGWAKPVPIDTRYYKNQRTGLALVSLAGPAMNFILGFLFTFIQLLILKYGYYALYTSNIAYYLYVVVYYTAYLNICLGLFNLIPIPPLDGSKVLYAFLPYETRDQFMQFERFGGIALILLLMCGLSSLLSPISSAVYNFFYNLSIMILF